MTDYISNYTGEEIDAGIAKANMVYNALPKVSDEGDNLTLDGTANCPMKMELKGNTEQTTYTGKNLLPNSESLSNTGQYQDVIRFTDLEPSTEYTLKVKGTAGDKFYTGGSMPYSSLTIPSNGVLELTFTTNSTISDVAIIKNTTATNTLPLTECTLCKGSTATYEPYVGGTPSPNPDYPQDVRVVTGNNTITIANSDNTQSQTHPINLGTMELCKIGDYQDYIYKENNKWYKHSEIGKVVLDGSEENLSYNSTVNRLQMPFNLQTQDWGVLALTLCDHFTMGDTEIVDGSFNITRTILFFKNNNLTSLNDWKTWLGSNNTTVYYVLATPTNTEITDTTLISQLNAIENAVSYDTQTNIVQENYSEPFIINAECVRSLKDIFELIGNS